jgi:hypothetical protein
LLLNVANTEKLFVDSAQSECFMEMAEAYRRNPDTFVGLMQWNSPQAVERIAEHFGFRLLKRGWFYTFERGDGPAPALNIPIVEARTEEELGSIVNPRSAALRLRTRSAARLKLGARRREVPPFAWTA